MDEMTLTKQVAEDLKAVLTEALRMGCKEVKRFNHIPLENVAVVIKALEKQIPKKPLVEAWSPALCPCCNAELSESIGDGYYKHYTTRVVCICGQHLDWSEVE